MHDRLVQAVLAGTMAFISSTALAQQKFDGRWSVETVPEKGACKKPHRYALMIENGSIRQAGSRRLKVNVSGGLDTSGRIQGSVRRNRTQVDVTGNLSGRSGSGGWAASGSVSCSGRWVAEKQS